MSSDTPWVDQILDVLIRIREDVFDEDSSEDTVIEGVDSQLSRQFAELMATDHDVDWVEEDALYEHLGQTVGAFASFLND